jgi:hypothetical protein
MTLGCGLGGIGSDGCCTYCENFLWHGGLRRLADAIPACLPYTLSLSASCVVHDMRYIHSSFTS